MDQCIFFKPCCLVMSPLSYFFCKMGPVIIVYYFPRESLWRKDKGRAHFLASSFLLIFKKIVRVYRPFGISFCSSHRNDRKVSGDSRWWLINRRDGHCKSVMELAEAGPWASQFGPSTPLACYFFHIPYQSLNRSFKSYVVWALIIRGLHDSY